MGPKIWQETHCGKNYLGGRGVFFVILGEAVQIISENYSWWGRGYANNFILTTIGTFADIQN